jgi:hypothetical protein
MKFIYEISEGPELNRFLGVRLNCLLVWDFIFEWRVKPVLDRFNSGFSEISYINFTSVWDPHRLWLRFHIWMIVFVISRFHVTCSRHFLLTRSRTRMLRISHPEWNSTRLCSRSSWRARTRGRFIMILSPRLVWRYLTIPLWRIGSWSAAGSILRNSRWFHWGRGSRWNWWCYLVSVRSSAVWLDARHCTAHLYRPFHCSLASHTFTGLSSPPSSFDTGCVDGTTKTDLSLKLGTALDDPSGAAGQFLAGSCHARRVLVLS